MTIPLTKIRVEVAAGDLCLTRACGSAKVTLVALRHLCELANVPFLYAQRIPSTLLSSNLNHGLAYRQTAPKETAVLSIRNGRLESIKIK